MPIMSKEAWSKNLRIAALLTVCYVLGMVAAYQTTQMLVHWRGGDGEAASSEVVDQRTDDDLLTDASGSQ